MLQCIGDPPGRWRVSTTPWSPPASTCLTYQTVLVCLYQKQELTVSEARLLTQNGGEELGKENGPSEAALLQASISRLNSDIEELRAQCGHKDAEVTSLRSQLDKAQADLLHAVSWQMFLSVHFLYQVNLFFTPRRFRLEMGFFFFFPFSFFSSIVLHDSLWSQEFSSWAGRLFPRMSPSPHVS